MDYLKKITCRLDLFSQCRKYNIKAFQCPQFLFVLMGIVIILSIFATNIVARKFTAPEIVALIVLGVTAVLFIIAHIIVASFDRMASAAREKSEFISIISHRLRSPLSAIKWQTEILSGRQAPASGEQKEDVVLEIDRQNEKIITIVNDLLELNRIEDRNLVLNPSTFSLKEMVELAVESHKDAASQNNASLYLSVPDSLPDVYADKIRIKNVVSHLLDNAIRYSVNGGKITITLEKFHDSVRCLVADEGVGIPDKEKNKIFSKFFRSEKSVRYQTEGTGIGLFISKKIVEASKGRMGFNSIEGRGATFWFTLPVRAGGPIAKQ